MSSLNISPNRPTEQQLGIASQASNQASDPAALRLIQTGHPQRSSLEGFIQQGFAERYQAQVQRFMPYLLGVGTSDSWQAVLGVRFAATEPLFTEHYLSQPVEQLLCERGFSASRQDIAEIGHLLAVNRQALMQLFVLMAQGLHQLGSKYLVFAATREVQLLLRRHGIELTELLLADPSCLGEQANAWGSYYQTQPMVCVLQLAQVAERLAGDARLQQLIFQHWPQLHHLVDSLQESMA